MNRGKNICKQLKAVRRRIAMENGIPLDIPECTWKGECRGTCPQCEAEVRYLENALTDRLRLGKVATVAGLALGLAATAQAQAQAPQTDTRPMQDTTENHKAECCGMLKGTVIDIKTNEGMPFCKVTLMQDGKQVRVAVTDLDGVYIIKPLCYGKYSIEIRYPGYKTLDSEVEIATAGYTILDVSLEYSGHALSPVEIEAEGNDNYDFPVIGEIQVTLPGTPASEPGDQPQRIEALTPLPGNEPQLIGGIGHQTIDDVRGGAVEAVRVGPRLIVVEPKEPSL